MVEIIFILDIVCMNRGNEGRMLKWGEYSPNFLLIGGISKRGEGEEEEFPLPNPPSKNIPTS